MFSRWGAFVYRFRRPIVVIMLGVAVVMATFATRASSGLSSGGRLDPGSESAQVADRLATDFGGGRSSVIVLFRGGPGADAHDVAVLGDADLGDRLAVAVDVLKYISFYVAVARP